MPWELKVGGMLAVACSMHLPHENDPVLMFWRRYRLLMPTAQEQTSVLFFEPAELEALEDHALAATAREWQQKAMPQPQGTASRQGTCHFIPANHQSDWETLGPRSISYPLQVEGSGATGPGPLTSVVSLPLGSCLQVADAHQQFFGGGQSPHSIGLEELRWGVGLSESR